MTLPLLMIPGLNCTAALWAAQLCTLGAGRLVAVADHTAHDAMADLAAAILADAPPRFALAGLSMGGYLAFEILRQAPHRVDRLALLDTQARADSPEAQDLRRQQIAIAARGGFARIPELQIPKLVAARHQGDAALTGIVRSMAMATGAEAFMRQQTAILNRIDSRSGLAAIRCPTLVLVGAEDVITPPDLAREMRDGIAGSRLVVVEEAGHLSTLEQPEAVSAALRDWLLG
ncbi:alpha/beta hydrolase [Prosthecodimorpha staleyi]|uniref:alpha/beta hydrolase n=1 Tax=Prosthecodimorpha staleyi TaxID=2840188 RepID=UPI0021C2D953|nr:alpha/beta hydrolase [Prosthecodimorpha staleyi]